MTKAIDFYFDIISPFSYLAHTQLPEIAARHGCTIRYRPMDIPLAKLAAGNYGPSNRDVPAKLKALGQDMQRWAARYGVPLTFPKGFDGLRWNIGAIFAERNGGAGPFVREAYNRIWGEGIDPADPVQLRDAVAAAGLNENAFIDYVHSSQGETDFRQSCVEAHRAGVFGAPIMIVDDQVYWGNDRLEFLEEYLCTQSAKDEQGMAQ